MDSMGMTARIFPPQAFAENKIVENVNKHRFSYDQPMDADTLRNWLSGLVRSRRTEKSGRDQLYADYARPDGRDKTRFITDIRYCPDPLPEGGTEIQLDV